MGAIGCIIFLALWVGCNWLCRIPGIVVSWFALGVMMSWVHDLNGDGKSRESYRCNLERYFAVWFHPMLLYYNNIFWYERQFFTSSVKPCEYIYKNSVTSHILIYIKCAKCDSFVLFEFYSVAAVVFLLFLLQFLYSIFQPNSKCQHSRHSSPFQFCVI